MLELAPLNRNCFNHQFLTFRIRYYFIEASDLIARHKLLCVFIFCLLAPGVKSIQAIGTPFYALIDPTVTFKLKFFYLAGVLFALLSLTKAQSSSIKGGAFRDYLHTLYVPHRIHKWIDFIILVLSLHIIWLAVFFGGVNIFHDKGDALFRVSQAWLYASTVFALCTLLFNFLHKNTGRVLTVCLALLLIVVFSKQGRCLLNFGLGAGMVVLCGIILKTAQLHRGGKTYSCNMSRTEALNDVKDFFIIQLAVLRRYNLSFLIRFALCCSVSMLILNALPYQETIERRQMMVLVLAGLQTYILSTLFIFFEKERLHHAVFHHIFPFQKKSQPLKDVMLVWAGVTLVLMPVLFCTDWIAGLRIATISGFVLAINRVLYALSLQFCLFSSLLATAGAYVLMGGWYGG